MILVLSCMRCSLFGRMRVMDLKKGEERVPKKWGVLLLNAISLESRRPCK